MAIVILFILLEKQRKKKMALHISISKLIYTVVADRLVLLLVNKYSSEVDVFQEPVIETQNLQS